MYSVFVREWSWGQYWVLFDSQAVLLADSPNMYEGRMTNPELHRHELTSVGRDILPLLEAIPGFYFPMIGSSMFEFQTSANDPQDPRTRELKFLRPSQEVLADVIRALEAYLHGAIEVTYTDETNDRCFYPANRSQP